MNVRATFNNMYIYHKCIMINKKTLFSEDSYICSENIMACMGMKITTVFTPVRKGYTYQQLIRGMLHVFVQICFLSLKVSNNYLLYHLYVQNNS